VGKAVGSVLPLAVAVAIFPVPIIAMVIIVGSERGRAKGFAFVAAWVAGLAAVGALALVLAGALDASSSGGPATWVAVVLLLLGLLLVWLAIKQWLGRPRRGEQTSLPGWMQKIDDFGASKAAVTGFTLSALNPKNVLLVSAAALEIAEFGPPRGQQAVVLLVFVVLASAGVLAPLVLSVVLGERSGALLEGIRGWMAQNNAVIMTVLFLLIGAKLIGDSISGLSS
jgi:threonine/homoserine/homoserine lactone efflux protein